MERQPTPRDDAPDLTAAGEARRMNLRRRRWITIGGSLAAHAGMLLVLLSPRTAPPPPREAEPMVVQLVEPLPPPPPPIAPTKEPTPSPAPAKAAEPTPPKPAPPKPPPRRNIFRAAKAPPTVAPLPAGKGPSADGADEVSEGQLASARTAGSGSPGGDCDMARRLQIALRKDRQVQAAAAQAHNGKAIMVWNGDWVRHGAQDGAGLAAVREIMTWEIGFAPKACRTEAVRGLVLLTLDDGPGAPRLVLGGGEWRWSDLLFSRRSGTVASASRP
jgi:hypothetical protein